MLLDLPQELLIQIVAKLKVLDLGNLALVNKKSSALFNQEDFWKSYIKQLDFPSEIILDEFWKSFSSKHYKNFFGSYLRLLPKFKKYNFAIDMFNITLLANDLPLLKLFCSQNRSFFDEKFIEKSAFCISLNVLQELRKANNIPLTFLGIIKFFKRSELPLVKQVMEWSEQEGTKINIYYGKII